MSMGEPGDADAVAETLEVSIREQGVSLPAVLAWRLIPDDARARISVEQVAAVLRTSDRFRETSPGMFAVADSAESSDMSVPALPSRTGVLMEELLATSVPLGADEQLAMFRLHSALRVLAQYDDAESAKRELDATISRLLPEILLREGWTLEAAHRAATSGAAVPYRDQSEHGRDERSALLSAIYALEWAEQRDIDDAAQRADSLRTELVRRNLRLVAAVIETLSPAQFVRWADAFQAGVAGLLTAFTKFDPYYGFTFSTYASHWIRQAATRQVADEDRVIRLPVHVVEELNRVLRARRGIETEAGELASPEVIAASLSGTDGDAIAPSRVAWLLELNRPVLSWDVVSHSNQEVVPGGQPAGLEPNELREQLDAVLGLVAPDRRHVLEDRFGWHGEPQTLEAIGQRAGVSRERIRQKEAKTLERLRDKRDLIRRYLDGRITFRDLEMLLASHKVVRRRKAARARRRERS